MGVLIDMLQLHAKNRIPIIQLLVITSLAVFIKLQHVHTDDTFAVVGLNIDAIAGF